MYNIYLYINIRYNEYDTYYTFNIIYKKQLVSLLFFSAAQISLTTDNL